MREEDASYVIEFYSSKEVWEIFGYYDSLTKAVNRFRSEVLGDTETQFRLTSLDNR